MKYIRTIRIHMGKNNWDLETYKKNRKECEYIKTLAPFCLVSQEIVRKKNGFIFLRVKRCRTEKRKAYTVRN